MTAPRPPDENRVFYAYGGKGRGEKKKRGGREALLKSLGKCVDKW